jgi:hypothetical protein
LIQITDTCEYLQVLCLESGELSTKSEASSFFNYSENEPLTETNLEQLELNKGRQGGLSDVLGQASNILENSECQSEIPT